MKEMTARVKNFAGRYKRTLTIGAIAALTLVPGYIATRPGGSSIRGLMKDNSAVVTQKDQGIREIGAPLLGDEGLFFRGGINLIAGGRVAVTGGSFGDKSDSTISMVNENGKSADILIPKDKLVAVLSSGKDIHYFSKRLGMEVSIKEALGTFSPETLKGIGKTVGAQTMDGSAR